jgi:hypothetical protein
MDTITDQKDIAMTTTQIKERLRWVVDTVSKRGNVFTVRKSFFYTNGYSSLGLANAIKVRLENVTIIDHGEKWADFKGGEDVAKQSHWWVKFSL